MTTATRQPTDGYLTVPRIRDRRPATADLMFVYHPASETLHIFTDWSERLNDWRQWRTYTVQPFDCDLPGRAFRLLKRGGGMYDLLLNDDGMAECDCRGHVAHGHCCHADVLRVLADEGQI